MCYGFSQYISGGTPQKALIKQYSNILNYVLKYKYIPIQLFCEGFRRSRQYNCNRIYTTLYTFPILLLSIKLNSTAYDTIPRSSTLLHVHSVNEITLFDQKNVILVHSTLLTTHCFINIIYLTQIYISTNLLM